MRERSARAGFTMIEMMAVIVILAILIAFLVPRLLDSGDTVRARNTKAFLATVTAKVHEYEQDHGDYPLSTPLPEVDLPNKINVGSELLIVALFAPGQPDPGLPEDRLSNTDVDRSRKSLTSFPLSDLYELADDWGNPIAYFHRADYSQPADYQTVGADGSEWIQTVRARKSKKTDDYYNRTGFQLISAGIDGEFGTKDDIGNFEAESE